MRFALLQDHDDEEDDGDDDDELNTEHPQRIRKHNLSAPVQSVKQSVEITCPASISVEELLRAGRLVRPKARKLISFEVEKFNMENRQWEPGTNITAMVDDEKFSSGGFRDAFLAVEKGSSKKKWVVKKYNLNALRIISDTLMTSVENHTRKQVQMNSVARVIARKFEDEEAEIYFCCGNLAHVAIDTFMKNHVCNKYCEMLDLKQWETLLDSTFHIQE